MKIKFPISVESVFRWTGIFVIISLSFMVLSCSDDDDEHITNTNYSASADFDYRYSVEDRIGLNLSAINGSVSIAGEADLDSILITGERRVESSSVADAEEHLALLTVVVEPGTNQLSVRTEQPQQSQGRNYYVEYTVRVPATFSVNVNQVNGTVAVDSIQGGVNAQVVNGTLLLGDVVSNVQGNVTNGTVTCRMTILPTGICQLNAVNGTIGLQIPTNTSASLSATVVVGTINITGLALNNAVITPTHVGGMFGEGNGAITLSTTNGSIAISSF